MVEGHCSFVCEEDLPLAELEFVFGAGGGGEEGFRKGLGEGTTGNGDLEVFVTVQTGGLGLEDVGSQGGRELVDVWEREEVRLSAHDCEDSWWWERICVMSVVDCAGDGGLVGCDGGVKWCYREP